MKKVILLFIIGVILILLTGCGSSSIFNLSNFVIPDDIEFLALIKELDKPEKICQYMADNFGIEEHPYNTLTPYELYKIKKGDCDDFSNFAVFIANYHGYETYQILMLFPKPIYPIDTWHAIAIYKENNCYTFSELQRYNPDGKCHNSFNDIMQIFGGWTKYKVYDYDMNIIETGYNN